jgi:hypothetical protein
MSLFTGKHVEFLPFFVIVKMANDIASEAERGWRVI